MLSPFSTDAARMPDAFSATVVAKYIDRLDLTKVDDSGNTNDYFGVMINPSLKGHYAQIASAAS
jgi:hypothetical protein